MVNIFQKHIYAVNNAWLPVHGHWVAVFKAERGFVFLPTKNNSKDGYYVHLTFARAYVSNLGIVFFTVHDPVFGVRFIP